MISSMARNSLAKSLEAGQTRSAGWILPTHRTFPLCWGEVSTALRADQAVLELQYAPLTALSLKKIPYNPHRSIVKDRARNPRFPPLDV